MLHEPDITEQFRAAMREKDIVVNDEIIGDGKIHRVHVDGDRKGSRNAWYILHLDDKPAGAFGCNRRYGQDQKFTWSAKSKSKPLTLAERRALRERIEQQKREREAAERARYDAAARRAQAIWDASKDATDDHPYLKRKKIRAHGLRLGTWELINPETCEVSIVTKNALLVPIRDRTKRIRSLQAIFPSRMLGDRDKDYLKDGEKIGFFYAIGKPVQVDDKFVILICEGYATGASLHEATGHAVIVAFDAGNLTAVAKSMRERFPDYTIVVAADNDRWTLKPINNPGVTRAREAAAAVGGLVAVPEFADLDGNPTDFNDLHVREGTEAVRAVIDAALRPPPAPEPEPEPPAPDDTEPAGEAPPDGPDDDDDEDGRPENNGYFTILGYNRERYFIFSHEKRQIAFCTKADFSESGLIELAPLNWWEMNFPGEKASIDKKAAVNFLVRTATKRGIYDISRIRGRGAWFDEKRVVFHHGGHLTVDGERTDITKINSWYVYELDRSLPMPADMPLTDEEGKKLLETAKLFRWTMPASAALLAGFCVLAPLCGALRWRPHIWLTGGAGCGKSTVLNEYVHPLMNGMDVYAQGNSSEAGIRQTLKADALPVLFDEAEQNDEREKNRVQGILSLIRQASTESQAKTLKGTAGGDAINFHIRSMFCLAAIQVGMDKKADFDRLSILRLKPRHDDRNAADTWKRIKDALYEIQRDPTIAARLFRRSLDLMPVIQENIDVFTEAAAKRFGSQRDGDQYGTLLAGAWSLTSRKPATYADAEAMIDSYDWSEHLENSDVDESQRALAALMEAHIRINGIEVTVYELVCEASGFKTDGVDIGQAKAGAILQRHGMRVKDGYLLLSNQSEELKRLMADTSFEADLRGVLLRIKGVDKNDNKPVKFNGVSSKCLRLPLEPILSDLTGADAAQGSFAGYHDDTETF